MRAALLVALAALTMGAAPADDARARADALVREGAALGERGAWAEAIARFREASALFPRALDHCNLGLAYVRWGKPAAGWLHLTRCEARATEALPRWVAVRRDEALAALAAGDYAPVEVVTAPRTAEVRVDAFPDEVLTTPVTVWLPFGEHAFTVTAPTYAPAALSVTVSDRTPIRRTVTLAPSAPDPPAESTPAESTPTESTPTESTPTESTPTEPPGLTGTVRTEPLTLPPPGPPPGWYVAGGGAVVGAVGGVLYVVAAGTRKDAAALPPGDAFVAKRAAFRRERDAAYVLFGVGGAAVATGLVMLLWPGDEAPALQVVPVAGGASVGVGLGF